MLRKANECQYALRKLKKCGINDQDIMLIVVFSIIVVYCPIVKEVLEYGCVVFNNVSKYLLELLKRVQKRGMNIFFSSSSYEAALVKASLATLESPRADLCKRCMSKLDLDHPCRKLAHSRALSVQRDYSTRLGARIRPRKTRSNRLKDYVTEIFVSYS